MIYCNLDEEHTFSKSFALIDDNEIECIQYKGQINPEEVPETNVEIDLFQENEIADAKEIDIVDQDLKVLYTFVGSNGDTNENIKPSVGYERIFFEF